MPLRGSPFSRFAGRGRTHGGPAKPVPRLLWCGLLCGPLSRISDAASSIDGVRWKGVGRACNPGRARLPAGL